MKANQSIREAINRVTGQDIGVPFVTHLWTPATPATSTKKFPGAVVGLVPGTINPFTTFGLVGKKGQLLCVCSFGLN